MKNIYLLPTDKPSVISKNSNFLSLATVPTKQIQVAGLDNYINQNIYITSAEKFIRDEYISDGLEMIKASPKLVDAQGLVNRRNWKKIILTTDQELIKDGVQPIPNEFLEWFVKNPSCEEVDFNMDWCGQCDAQRGLRIWDYKIIIPKAISRCCGRCNGVDDLCYTDMCCDDHHKYGCEECYGPRVTYEYQKEPEMNKIQNEIFEMEQELGVPSHLRWHNSKPKVSIKKEYIDDQDAYGYDVLVKEPKQVLGVDFEFSIDDEGMSVMLPITKQETLEDALKEFSPLKYKGEMPYNKIDMIEFTKSQQSEEEVINLIQFLSMNEEFNGYGSVSKETAKFFLRRYKESK